MRTEEKEKKSKEGNEGKNIYKEVTNIVSGKRILSLLCSRYHQCKMPSFKERFRSSRKYKKNKDAAASGTDENATGPDDHTGSGASSSHYSVDYRKYS